MSEETIREYLSGKVAALNLGIPVKMPGKDMPIPKNATYGEFWIMGAQPFPAGGFGEGKILERTPGVIQLTVWIPENGGTQPGTLAIDLWGKGFKWKLGRDDDGATYKFKGVQTVTPQIKSAYTCMVARIAFTRDEIVPIQRTL